MIKKLLLVGMFIPTITLGQTNKPGGNNLYMVPHETYKVISGSDTIETKLDSVPHYRGGVSKMNFYLASNIRYPDSARERNISGTVKIMFIIDSNGKTYDYKVVGSVYPCLDREALRVVKEMQDNWVAGILNGQKVKTLYMLPIRFVLR